MLAMRFWVIGSMVGGVLGYRQDERWIFRLLAVVAMVFALNGSNSSAEFLGAREPQTKFRQKGLEDYNALKKEQEG